VRVAGPYPLPCLWQASTHSLAAYSSAGIHRAQAQDQGKDTPMYANVKGCVPVQTWVTPEKRQAIKAAARRAGISLNQAGGEAFEGWLEWAARCDLEASRKIAQEHAEEGMLIEA
jgi:hypothetical protein